MWNQGIRHKFYIKQLKVNYTPWKHHGHEKYSIDERRRELNGYYHTYNYYRCTNFGLWWWRVWFLSEQKKISLSRRFRSINRSRSFVRTDLPPFGYQFESQFMHNGEESVAYGFFTSVIIATSRNRTTHCCLFKSRSTQFLRRGRVKRMTEQSSPCNNKGL